MSKLHVLPGAAAARGYRIGSRSRGRTGMKFYIALNRKRISPYFPAPRLAADWLRSKITM